MRNYNNFMYFIQPNKFAISDTGAFASSHRTFDVAFNDLANNELLLNLLSLYYIQGNHATKYTYDTRALFFAGYLSAFEKNQQIENQKYQKLICNPTVRLLVLDDNILHIVSNLIKNKLTYNYKCTKCSFEHINVSRPLDYELCQAVIPMGTQHMVKCRGKLVEIK